MQLLMQLVQVLGEVAGETAEQSEKCTNVSFDGDDIADDKGEYL